MKILKNSKALFLIILLMAADLLVWGFAAKPSNGRASFRTVIQNADQQVSAQKAVQVAAHYGGAESMQYALWEEGKVTLTGHLGSYSRMSQRDITDNNLYGIGSVSKVYTAAAVMKLVEDGKIQLDAPVIQYLPSFKMVDERYKKITVRMLLNHSSGLLGSSDDSVLLFQDNDQTATQTLLKKLSTQRLKSEPGAYSAYCNNGYVLAELVVEAVSGTSFAEYIHDNLLVPLGLNSTFTPCDTFDTSLLVKTYYDMEDTRPLPQDCVTEIGVAGLYATASDLAAFGGALTGSEILSEASLNAMSSSEYAKGIWPEDDLDLFSFGLGWDSVETYPFGQNKIQALAKNGDTMFYHAALVVIPQYHLSAAVVSTGGTSNFNELVAIRMLIDALAQRGIEINEALPALPPGEKSSMPREISECTGYYGASGQQFRAEISDDGKLELQNISYSGSPIQTFCYYNDGSFRSEDNPTRLIKFVKESNGQTYLYEKTYTEYPDLGTIPWSQYTAMKLPENTVRQEVQTTWNAAYYTALPVNEKYDSQAYMAITPQNAMDTMIPPGIPGYIASIQIIDDTHAQFLPQIPELGGKDGTDLTLSYKNGCTLLTANAKVYIQENSIPDIASTEQSLTIQSDGYARWYRVGDAAGKVMTVTTPENGGFYVYDAEGQIVASSVMWNDSNATLPANGFIVFAGDTGAQFYLQFSKTKSKSNN